MTEGNFKLLGLVCLVCILAFFAILIWAGSKDCIVNKSKIAKAVFYCELTILLILGTVLAVNVLFYSHALR